MELIDVACTLGFALVLAFIMGFTSAMSIALQPNLDDFDYTHIHTVM
jgi:hypothetical protein